MLYVSSRTAAGRYAPRELGEARTKLASANTADVKANAVNEEMKRSTGTLIEEMPRNSADKQ